MCIRDSCYTDQNITPELANRRLALDKVVVGWYSNRQVHQSVTHSHPYHCLLYTSTFGSFWNSYTSGRMMGAPVRLASYSAE